MRGFKKAKKDLGRGRSRWSLVLYLGELWDEKAKRLKPKQQWITFDGTERQADEKLAQLVQQLRDDDLPENTRTTFGKWLQEWLETSVKPPLRRPSTYRVYKNIITNHVLTSPLSQMRLQKLRGAHIERYLAELTDFTAATVQTHFAMLRRALEKAKKARFIRHNPAEDVDRPELDDDPAARVKGNCWTVDQAKAFLKAADALGTQFSTFAALFLDTGTRKSELLGLTWDRVNLDKRTVQLDRQLDGHAKDGSPIFGPVKTKKSREFKISTESVNRLRTHKAQQAALKLKNGEHYKNYNLVFAKEPQRPPSQHHEARADARRTGGPLHRESHQGRRRAAHHRARLQAHEHQDADQSERAHQRDQQARRPRESEHDAECLRARAGVGRTASGRRARRRALWLMGG